MGSGSPIKIRWTLRPQYVVTGGTIASNVEGDMALFDEPGPFFSSGYAYPPRRCRARVPLSLRETSTPYEVEACRPYSVRYFDAGRFSETPAVKTQSY